MRPSKSLLVRAGILLTAVSTIFYGPSAAAATGYNLKTYNGGLSWTKHQSGHAEARGTVTFNSRSQVTVRISRLADVCNSSGTADGAGAYLFVLVRLNGGSVLQAFGVIAKDADGCSNGRYFSGSKVMTLRKTDGSGDRVRIAAFRIRISECNGGATNCSPYAGDNRYSPWMGNPYK